MAAAAIPDQFLDPVNILFGLDTILKKYKGCFHQKAFILNQQVSELFQEVHRIESDKNIDGSKKPALLEEAKAKIRSQATVIRFLQKCLFDLIDSIAIPLDDQYHSVLIPAYCTDGRIRNIYFIQGDLPEKPENSQDVFIIFKKALFVSYGSFIIKLDGLKSFSRVAGNTFKLISPGLKCAPQIESGRLMATRCFLDSKGCLSSNSLLCDSWELV